MTIPDCPYYDSVTNGCTGGSCTMIYSSTDGTTPSTDPTLTISGTNLVIDATATTFTSLASRTVTK